MKMFKGNEHVNTGKNKRNDFFSNSNNYISMITTSLVHKRI